MSRHEILRATAEAFRLGARSGEPADRGILSDLLERREQRKES